MRVFQNTIMDPFKLNDVGNILTYAKSISIKSKYILYIVLILSRQKYLEIKYVIKNLS